MKKKRYIYQKIVFLSTNKDIFISKEEAFEFLKKHFDVRTRSQALQLKIAYDAGERELEKLLGFRSYFCEKCLESHPSTRDTLCNLRERKSFVGQFRNASCSICLEKFTQSTTKRLTVTLCGHFFHRSCICRNRREGRYNCPYCNEFLRETGRQLYLN